MGAVRKRLTNDELAIIADALRNHGGRVAGLTPEGPVAGMVAGPSAVPAVAWLHGHGSITRRGEARGARHCPPAGDRRRYAGHSGSCNGVVPAGSLRAG